MPAIRRPPSRTSSTGRTSPRGRPAFRSPSICRRRPATTPITSWRAARSARSACRSRISATCGRCFDGIPLDQMNTSMTINATARVAAGALRRRRRRAGRVARQAHRHDPERHHQGIPVARHLRVPARAVAAADQGHDRLLVPARCRSGTRPTSAPITCRKPARRRCRSWPSRWRPPCAVLDTVQGLGRGAGRAISAESVGRISFFVNAGLRFVTEICKMRAFAELWDEITRERYGVDRPEEPPVPLRRAGELARPHRAAAREQRLSHPHRDAGRDAVEERARPRRAAAGLERGARPAAAVGPAMVAAHAADPGLRDRPARVRRHLRRLAR